MKFLKKMMNKNSPAHIIVYKTAPHAKGHAKLVDERQMPLAARYGYPGLIDSSQFEAFQAQAQKHNIEILWLPY